MPSLFVKVYNLELNLSNEYSECVFNEIEYYHNTVNFEENMEADVFLQKKHKTKIYKLLKMANYILKDMKESVAKELDAGLLVPGLNPSRTALQQNHGGHVRDIFVKQMYIWQEYIEKLYNSAGYTLDDDSESVCRDENSEEEYGEEEDQYEEDGFLVNDMPLSKGGQNTYNSDNDSDYEQSVCEDVDSE